FNGVPYLSLIPWADGAVLVATVFFETAFALGRLTADPLLFEGTIAARISIVIGAACLALVSRLRRIYTPLVLVPALAGLLPARDDARELVIDILDIGQGSAAVVRVPDGPVLLFDAGIGPAPYDRGASTVLPFLQRLDRLPVDRFYGSHGDADHIGGAISLARRGFFKRVYIGGREGETTASTLLQGAVTAAGTPCASALDGSVESWGPVRLLTIFAPEDLRGGGPNDASLVQVLSYGDFRLWLGGDASSAREADLAERGLADRIPVLIASHHGARSSTPWSLLERARPQVAVISCGRNNRYGHPHSETVRRLEGIGARIVRTDRHGGVTIRTDGRTMRIETLLPEPAVSVYRLAPAGSRHHGRRVEG
ncbi:MAG: MBL fold metallo-hydrolase, partial [Gemmatimonadetes bacterium]|nr:MBL fold metallo-hydrolase [Gemmatimonadota bacterium]